MLTIFFILVCAKFRKALFFSFSHILVQLGFFTISLCNHFYFFFIFSHDFVMVFFCCFSTNTQTQIQALTIVLLQVQGKLTLDLLSYQLSMSNNLKRIIHEGKNNFCFLCEYKLVYIFLSANITMKTSLYIN